MILVADASFAAKVMLVEKHSDLVQSWWNDDDVIWWAPAFIGAEVESAIATHERNHPELVGAGRRRRVSTQWANMLDGIAQRAVNRELSDAAIRVIRDHGPVRGADACYVALGLDLAAESDHVVLGSFDKQQRRAAASAGLAVTPA